MGLLISFNRHRQSERYEIIQYEHPVQETTYLKVAVYARFPTFPNHSLSSVPGEALLRAVQDGELLIELEVNVTILDIYIGYEDASGNAEANDNEEETWGMYIGFSVGGLILMCLIVRCWK